MREALFSQDGWGGQHVNQDTNWDFCGSTELGIRVDPTDGERQKRESNINIGTELWEAKLRNGGQTNPQSAAKHPWSYTPATNIGGTWGVDDDERATANVWSGPPPTPQWSGGPPQQPHWNPPQANNWAAWGETHQRDPRLEHRAPPIDPRQDMGGVAISGRLNSDVWVQNRPPAPTKLAQANQWNVPPSDVLPPAVRCAVPGYVEAAAWAARDRVPPPSRWDKRAWNEASFALPKPTPPGWHNKAPEWAGALPPTQDPPTLAAYKDASAGDMFPPSQPSTQQLRSLVQQIQMAVSAGYLNHHILDQPLASQTLVLLNQLLQQIRILQQLVSQHALAASQANSQLVLRCSVQIPKTKQQIAKLQSDIAAQQAIYVEATDPPSSLQTSFSELALRDKVHCAGHRGVSQAHLTQWKLPTYDSESEFPRSPGPTKPISQLNPVDATWSPGAWWSEAGASAKESVYDLVAEFEPGKPWKGNPLKLAEKAPAVAAEGKAGERTLSPVSWNCKAPDKSTSAPPPTLAGPTWSDDKWKRSLAFASTWLLLKNLTAQVHCAGHRGVSQAHLTQWKLPTYDSESEFPRSPGPTKPISQLNPVDATWSPGAWWSEAGASAKESVYDLVAEFEPGKPWKGNPLKLAEKAPAVAAEGKAGERTLSPVSWNCKAPDKSTSAPPPTLAGPTWSDDKWKRSLAFASTWLLLKNLTAQIDEHTLQTLCRQHGPLQSFRLYLDQGVALARYSTREQASKAQSALNNCVLSNTTLFAESPADSDVQMILQHLGTPLIGTLRDT